MLLLIGLLTENKNTIHTFWIFAKNVIEMQTFAVYGIAFHILHFDCVASEFKQIQYKLCKC